MKRDIQANGLRILWTFKKVPFRRFYWKYYEQYDKYAEKTQSQLPVLLLEKGLNGVGEEFFLYRISLFNPIPLGTGIFREFHKNCVNFLFVRSNYSLPTVFLSLALFCSFTFSPSMNPGILFLIQSTIFFSLSSSLVLMGNDSMVWDKLDEMLKTFKLEWQKVPERRKIVRKLCYIKLKAFVRFLSEISFIYFFWLTFIHF